MEEDEVPARIYGISGAGGALATGVDIIGGSKSIRAGGNVFYGIDKRTRAQPPRYLQS